MPKRICLFTNDNKQSAELLDFYTLLESDLGQYILLVYEDIDQIPAIHRILAGHHIEVKGISVI
ncbi:MAG: hypothetical protein EOO88_01700 [Pedobacter sp.]|nr:MAG: hypothetical protein EOO88_01700 [Pedobacter sp.]